MAYTKGQLSAVATAILDIKNTDAEGDALESAVETLNSNLPDGFSVGEYEPGSAEVYDGNGEPWLVGGDADESEGLLHAIEALI